MRYFTLLLLAFCVYAGEVASDQPKLPPDVQKVVDARDKAIADAKVQFDSACLKATGSAAKQMESIVKSKTQKGDLDGAIAAKGIVEKWAIDQPDLVAEKPDAKPVKGGVLKPAVIGSMEKVYDEIMAVLKPIPAPETNDEKILKLFDAEITDANYRVSDGQTIRWSRPFKCIGLVLVTRPRGDGVDSFMEMTISVNGADSVSIKEVPSNSIIKIPLGGVVAVSEIKFKYKDRVNSPWFKKIALLP